MDAVKTWVMVGTIAWMSQTVYAASDPTQMVQQLNSQIQGQLQKIQEQQNNSMKDMNTKNQTQLKKIHDELDAKIIGVNKDLQDKLKQINDSLQSQIKQVQTDVKACMSQCSKPDAAPTKSAHNLFQRPATRW